ncbi:MAG: Uma2 family endonuclease [Gemmatimonadetes bacterium]|nr:Uma2 family endonuclease [Gemmatimonadota bacterium]
MLTRPVQTHWTYAEFARLPNDGKRYEVIGGELYVTPAPAPMHQLVLQRLNRLLDEFVNRNNLGWVLPAPCDVLLADGEYVEPDLIVVRRERRGIITERGIEAPPDLVVEIISDSTASVDRGPKREQYAYFGVPQYWIVDPKARRIEVYRFQEDPAHPTIHEQIVTWTPVGGGESLTIPVPDLFRGFE